MKNNLIISTMLAFAMGLGGCATTDADGNPTNTLASTDNDVVIAMNAAAAYDGDLPSGTAQSGDLLFAQHVGIENRAKIDASIDTSTMPLIGKKYIIDASDTLYPAMSLRFGQFYCVRDRQEAKGFDGLMGNTGHRACLRDSDDDGTFDQLWGADESTMRSQYSSVYVDKVAGTDLETPIPFELVSGDTAPTDHLGIFYTFRPTVFGGKQIVLKMAPVGEDGSPAYDTRDIETIPIKKAEFPLTVRHNGAEIVITSVDEDAKTIDYEVTSAFPVGEPVLLVSQRAVQIVYH